MTLEMCGREEEWVQALQSPRRTWLAVSRPSSGNKQGQSVNSMATITHKYTHSAYGKKNQTSFNLDPPKFRVFRFVSSENQGVYNSVLYCIE